MQQRRDLYRPVNGQRPYSGMRFDVLMQLCECAVFNPAMRRSLNNAHFALIALNGAPADAQSKEERLDLQLRLCAFGKEFLELVYGRKVQVRRLTGRSQHSDEELLRYRHRGCHAAIWRRNVLYGF